MRCFVHSVALVGLCMGMSSVSAQVNETINKEIEATKEVKAPAEAEEGWHKKLSIGSSASWANSSNVVGTADGNTFQISILTDGLLTYTKGSHNWVTQGKLVHTQSRTPALDQWVKAADQLDIQSTYRYGLSSIPWLGPFARASLTTAIFPGYFVSPIDQTLTLTETDGTSTTEELPAAERRDVTGAFDPLLLREVAGAMANPINNGAKLQVGFHIGAGAEEAFASGYSVSDEDPADGVAELTALQSYSSVGAEFEGNATGAVNEQVTWSAKLNLFQPFVTTAETELSGLDLLSTDFTAKVSVKLNKWASLDYSFGARNYPLIVEGWQLQQGLMLSATFNVL